MDGRPIGAEPVEEDVVRVVGREVGGEDRDKGERHDDEERDECHRVVPEAHEGTVEKARLGDGQRLGRAELVEGRVDSRHHTEASPAGASGAM